MGAREGVEDRREGRIKDPEKGTCQVDVGGEKKVLVAQLCPTPWTVAQQASVSVEFPRQEYWSGLLFPSRGNLSDPGVEPRFPILQADSLPSKLPGKPVWEEGAGIY